jgi:hypothetical protein
MTKYLSIALGVVVVGAAVLSMNQAQAQVTQSYTDSRGNVVWTSTGSTSFSAGVYNPNGIAGGPVPSTSPTPSPSPSPSPSPMASSGNSMILYTQSGAPIQTYNSSTNSLTPGWYYTSNGSPRYYYANGVYYDPATQTYGGSVLYPNANGPQTLAISTTGSVAGSGSYTPGVPNTGAGGTALGAWLALIISALAAFGGVTYLIRSKQIS